jgi:hypothetical protein
MRIENYLYNKAHLLGDYWQETKTAIYLLFVFLNVDLDIVKILSILMMADTALGAIKAVYLKDLRFTFERLLWGLISKATILTIPMVLALVALGLGFDFKWLIVLILRILVISEGISSITNILSIRKKENIENTDYISDILKGLRKFLESYLKKAVYDINKKDKND